jgi:hypothetical protein
MSEQNDQEQEPDKFDLDYQFFLYVKAFFGHPENIPVGMYGNVKCSFYAGIGAMMKLVTLDMPHLSKLDAEAKTRYMAEQITKFWVTEVDMSKGDIVNN